MTSFADVLEQLVRDTWQQSLPGFSAEVVLAATMVLMLLVRLFRWGGRFNVSALAAVGTLVALALAGLQAMDYNAASGTESRGLFSGLIVQDHFTVFFRIFLLLFGALVVWLTILSGVPDREDSPDFYTLLLGSLIGMSLMASANHLLIVFLGVEMASVPSYAMAGFLKGRRQSSEASLKYVVYGGGAAGVMLYGLSLLAGLTGTAHLPTVAARLGQIVLSAEGFTHEVQTVVLAVLMVLVGIAFKLAAVPFHFWCPDVFEGAATEVAAFLSVASKGAALGLLVRFVIGTGYGALGAVGADAVAALADVRLYLGAAVAVAAAVTATFGNLAAYAQTNMKRLLAYSTIAHAGYMMMPVAAALRLLNEPAATATAAAAGAIQAMLIYLAVYLFMNLGAFAVVTFIRNEIRSEDLSDYAGLWRRCPGLTVCMAIFLLSLTGIPPLAGFMAKFVIFASLVRAELYWLLVVAAINTVFSLFYYVKVLRVMILEDRPEAVPSPGLAIFSRAGFYTAAMAVPVLVLGVWWNWLNEWAATIAQAVFLVQS
ncbi:MAG: NADH-quinone oxidoreductase subunit N [Pirellulales bacterium]